MKYFVVFASLFVVAFATQEFCFNTISELQTLTRDPGADLELKKCSSIYGGMHHLQTSEMLHKFTNLHIKRSFQYLLLSTHFLNYKENREGFAKLYRKFSDSAWEDSISLIKYIAKRGGTHSFLANPTDTEEANTSTVKKSDAKGKYEQSELNSLSLAVDMQKALAKEAIEIHEHVIRKPNHDPEMAQFIEEEFAEKHAEEIRQLTGYVNDLSMQKDNALFLYLFDEFLQKQ